MSEFILYNTDDGDSEIKLILDNETKTVWLNQKQMAELFDVSVKTVNEHIINIYKEEELEENPTIRNFRIVQREGSRDVERDNNSLNFFQKIRCCLIFRILLLEKNTSNRGYITSKRG